MIEIEIKIEIKRQGRWYKVALRQDRESDPHIRYPPPQGRHAGLTADASSGTEKGRRRRTQLMPTVRRVPLTSCLGSRCRKTQSDSRQATSREDE